VIQRGEIAEAIIGVSNIINGNIPRWTLEKMREFDKFGEKLNELATECVQGKIDRTPIPREHDYPKTLEILSKAISEETIANIQSKFPQPFDDLASEFIVTLQNTWNHLSTIFPVSEYKDFTGVKNLLPTGDKTTAFFLKLMVLNDPLLAYMLISSGAMLKSQAEVVQEFYPTLSKAITDSLYAAIGLLSSGDKPFRMPERTKLGLNNWLGRRSVAYDPKPPAQVRPAPADSSKASPAAAVSLSPSQKVTEGGAVKNG
jgi:hypothetical protein